MQKTPLSAAMQVGSTHDPAGLHWRWRCTDPPDAQAGWETTRQQRFINLGNCNSGEKNEHRND
jgi:hypothetical protein